MDDKKVRITLAVVGLTIVVYSIGYQKGQTQTIRSLGSTSSSEALFYLAAQDHIRQRFGK